MKAFAKLPTAKWLLSLILVCFGVLSCQKETKQIPLQQEIATASNNNKEHGHLQQTKTFSADVVIHWLNMQLEMLRVPAPAGVAAPVSGRALAYCGIALYEAVEPGMPAYQTLSGQLNGLPSIPATEPGKAYHWAASANAALAYMCKNMYQLASAGNITAMNNLENELKNIYANETDAATLQRSIDFGRAVAQIVFDWAQADGSLTLPSPATYVIPIGPGLWEKTPPNFAGPVNPFASQTRLIVSNSDENTALAPPPAYSTDPSSEFYAMVKDVFDRSQNLTSAQTAMAIYHRDAPGYPGGGTLVAMLAQAFQQSDCKLDAAALAYAKVGMGSNDAGTIGFRQKYQVNLVRPITYIRNVMGYTTWNALFNTPAHPEFPSAHALNGGVISAMLTDVLGENFELILDHYNYLGLPARHYASFNELGKEMGDSRVFGGIHYQASCDKGFWLGKKVANNILTKVKFLKD